MAATLTADTVAQCLRDAATRPATLEELEALEEPVDFSLSVAAAAVLGELLDADTETVCQQHFDRIGMLLGRLCWAPEAYGAAFGDGRLARVWNSDANCVSRALRKSADELTVADARSMACLFASEASAVVADQQRAINEAGLTVLEWFGLWMSARPLSP